MVPATTSVCSRRLPAPRNRRTSTSAPTSALATPSSARRWAPWSSTWLRRLGGLPGAIGVVGTGNGGASPGYDLEQIEALNVPEPGSLSLIGLGLAGLVARRRRQRQ